MSTISFKACAVEHMETHRHSVDFDVEMDEDQMLAVIKAIQNKVPPAIWDDWHCQLDPDASGARHD